MTITQMEEGRECEYTPTEYAYLWISGCCPLHQWCSGARAVDQDVIDHVARLIQEVKRHVSRYDWSQQDADNLRQLLEYLKAEEEMLC